MKGILITLFLVVVNASTFAQTTENTGKITDTQWDSLFTELAHENWPKAFELSSTYLEQIKNDDNIGSAANLRYMLLYSAAGAVSDGKLGYDDIEKILPKVVGKKLATPFHPLGVECRPPMFNYICKSDANSEYDVFTTAANQAATSILAFEYTKLSKKFDIATHKEEMASVIGTVDKIVPNPNKSRLVILRIYIKDGEIVLQSDLRSKK